MRNELATHSIQVLRAAHGKPMWAFSEKEKRAMRYIQAYELRKMVLDNQIVFIQLRGHSIPANQPSPTH